MLSKHYLSKFSAVKNASRLKLSTPTHRYRSTTSSEYTSTPNYPPIYSLEPKAVEKRTIESKAEKLKKVPTVEEKLIALNVPRFWGWPSVMVNEGNVPYDFLPFAQHITRTRMIEVDSLPVSLPSSKLQEVMKVIKDQVEKIIVFELCHKNHKFYMTEDPLDLTEMRTNELLGKALIEKINRCILANLAPHAPHLMDVLVDFEPRHEAFWPVGGFYPSEEDKWYQRYLNKFWDRSDDNLDDPMDRMIQYIGSPVLAVRSRFPLDPIAPFPGPGIIETAVEPVADASEPGQEENKTPLKPAEITAGEKIPTERTFEVTSHKYDPRITYGLEVKRQYGLNVPGFLPNDRHEFGILSYHKRNHMLGRPPSFGEEHAEALHAQAILASYGWLLGQACYQGFSPYNNPTYPLTAQTVLTDGRLWSFYAYQLNTTTLYHDQVDENPHQNVCYGLKTTELYHSIEDGKVKGWNDKALETLFSFYLNKCQAREGVNMKPYLDPETPLVENIQDEEKRIWLDQKHRYFYPRRRKRELTPTIYEWERIYQIDNATMPMAARHKWHQKGEDPLNDDTWVNRYQRKYIPKSCRRPDRPKREKYERTFWPDALC